MTQAEIENVARDMSVHQVGVTNDILWEDWVGYAKAVLEGIERRKTEAGNQP